MIKAGSVVLTVWCVLNLLVGAGVVLYIVALGNDAPVLEMSVTEGEIQALNPEVLAATNSIAIFLNACIASVCLLSLFVIWGGLIKRQKWAFWSLLSSMGVLLVGGYLSDSVLGNPNLLAMNLGTLVLLLGFGLSGYAIFRSGRAIATLAASVLLVHPASAQAAELPPHDYAFVATEAISEPLALLQALRQHLIEAVADSGLAPSGYPRPCHVSSAPDPDHKGGSLLSCSDTAATGGEADGILLDPDGHFMQLSVVNFPDSRVYLAEVFLVPRFPYPPIGTDERLTIPRVVLRFPSVPTSWHPKIWSVVQVGIEASGARVVKRDRGA